MKVKLLPPKKNFFYVPPSSHTSLALTESLPFFRSGQGRYTHRVRSAVIYYRYGKPNHMAVSCWCGQTGFKDNGPKNGAFLERPGPMDILCATCEGRAIGSGQTGSNIICGHVVKFSPRYRGVTGGEIASPEAIA